MAKSMSKQLNSDEGKVEVNPSFEVPVQPHNEGGSEPVTIEVTGKPTDADDDFDAEREAQLKQPSYGLDQSGSRPLGDLVHEPDQGNVREVFTREGVGEVTTADAERVLERIREEGRYIIKSREDGEDNVFDVYRVGAGEKGQDLLIIVGARLDDLRKLI